MTCAEAIITTVSRVVVYDFGMNLFIAIPSEFSSRCKISIVMDISLKFVIE